MKMMTFNNGVCAKKVPDNIRIDKVMSGENRVPHRVRDGTLEVKEPLSGKLEVHFTKMVAVQVAAYYPLK